jgi:hypothetical protein
MTRAKKIRGNTLDELREMRERGETETRADTPALSLDAEFLGERPLGDAAARQILDPSVDRQRRAGMVQGAGARPANLHECCPAFLHGSAQATSPSMIGRSGKRRPAGRKPTLALHQRREARKRLEADETQCSVARGYNFSQSTISRLTSAS